MSNRKLICNADDFGIGETVSDIIMGCSVKGIITSTTLMANMPAAEYACSRSKDYPRLGIGVHLTLTLGKPVLPADRIPLLVDQDGHFLSRTQQRKKLWRGGRHYENQIMQEFAAQIERAYELGIIPTHCDSHHAVHKFPSARRALYAAVERYGLFRVRTSSTYFWCSPSATPGQRIQRCMRDLQRLPLLLSHREARKDLQRRRLGTPDQRLSPNMLIGAPSDAKQRLLATLDILPAGITELVFHPGGEDAGVVDTPRFLEERKRDTRLVCDNDIIQRIKDSNIALVHYGAV